MALAIGGTAYVKQDGNQFLLRGNLKIQPLNLQSEMVVGQDSVHGYKQVPLAPSIELDVSDIDGLSIADLQQVTGGATITAELKNGKIYVLSDAVYIGPAELDGTDGKITLKFSGTSMQEIS